MAPVSRGTDAVPGHHDRREKGEMDIQEEIRQAVSKGMTWLKSDEARNLGYDLNRVNLDGLDMTNPNLCVLGQAAAPTTWYWDAPRPGLGPRPIGGEGESDWHEARKEWDTAHGFCANEDSWDQLEDAWKAAIRAERDDT